MKIAVNKMHFPVTVLGPGRRVGIWTQGCSIQCKGCVSKDTWDGDATREMELDALLKWCRETTENRFDGVTISGGEPFDQPAALLALLGHLHQWRDASRLDFDILCYSGYPLRLLRARHPSILALLDAIIAEPYVDALPMTEIWRGSSNQRLVSLSTRGDARFGVHLVAPEQPAEKRIQVSVEGNRVWYIGIPSRGDMELFEKKCAERGVTFGQVSWRQ